MRPSRATPASLLAGLVLLALPPVLADPNAPCYDTTHSYAPGYYPCETENAFITHCCAPGYTCFSNNLCVVTTETHAYPNLTLGQAQRSMCTDPSWNNNVCADFCLSAADADGDMIACGNNRFCCLGDYNAGRCNCTAKGDSFVINPGIANTIIGVTESFTGTASYLTSRPTPSSTRATTTASSSSPSSPSSSASPASTVVSSSSPSTPTSTATDTATATPPPKKKQGLVVGLGVGISVGVVLLGLIAGLVAWVVRRRNRIRAYAYSAPAQDDIAIDGTNFGAQMAAQANQYIHGPASSGAGAINANGPHIEMDNLPPPPPAPQPQPGSAVRP